jgi:hypothetical protein
MALMALMAPELISQASHDGSATPRAWFIARGAGVFARCAIHPTGSTAACRCYDRLPLLRLRGSDVCVNAGVVVSDNVANCVSVFKQCDSAAVVVVVGCALLCMVEHCALAPCPSPPHVFNLRTEAWRLWCTPALLMMSQLQ